MAQYTKAIISSNYVELTHQTTPPPIKTTSAGGRKPSSKQSMDNYETNLKVSISRARKQIRRLLECNFTNQYAFLTLTFKPSEELDVTDIKSCNKMFADFKKRLSYYLKKNQLPDFKYLGVVEFQEENRGGAIHYHMICNLTKIPLKTIQDLWTCGWIHRTIAKSNAIENEKIANYLRKGISDQRLNNSKRYFRSQGLKQPIIVEINNHEEFYCNLDECQPTLIDGGTYYSPFSGETKYENYYVDNAKELIEYVQEL